MKLYNTLSGKKEEFKPLEPGHVKMYACGPTVYNRFHIGNARMFVLFDLFRRYLEFRDYKVTFVQNFTDIDDKIIKRSNEENIPWDAVSEKYIGEYFIDAKGLRINEATVHPKATENIGKIIEIVENLIKKGFAYNSNGDVYFNSRSFKTYGKLSRQSIDDLESGSRIDINEDKKDPLDFALWKSAKPNEPFWDSPWGKGRPGWHIECSAMVDQYLGKTIDIHGGGQDLIFPHHENEIAQSEAYNDGCTFARFWLHNGYINVDNVKMSKSLNNYFMTRDAAEVHGYRTLRFFLISAHYRSPINYSSDILEQSKSALARLDECRENLSFHISKAQEQESNEASDEETVLFSKYRAMFIEAMDDDFNTADGISVIFRLVRDINIMINTQTPPKQALLQAERLFDELVGILGIEKDSNDEKNATDACLEISEDEIQTFIDERIEAKKAKNYARADEIRNMLKEKGVVLEDTVNGTKWSSAK